MALIGNPVFAQRELVEVIVLHLSSVEQVVKYSTSLYFCLAIAMNKKISHICFPDASFIKKVLCLCLLIQSILLLSGYCSF